MSPGHRPEAEEPRGSHARPEGDLDWTAWRQGPGYSEPVPPDAGDEAGGQHRPPGAHRAPAAYPAPAGYSEPPAYPAPAGYGDPSAYPAPGGYGDPSAYPEPEGYGGPEDYEEAEAYEPGDYDDEEYGPQAAGPYTATSPRAEPDDDYGGFWTPELKKPGRFRGRARRGERTPGTGTHQPPVSQGAPPRRDGPGRRPAGRNAGFLIGVAAIAVIAAVVALVLLLRHHGPSRQAAVGSSRHPGASGTPSPPRRFGASGHLGIPAQIAGLRLNPRLTLKFVGPRVMRQDASSFSVPASDVVSGFYTANPSASTFTARDSRIMFITAYLAGAGNIASALHGFMTNHTFYAQRQISAGPLGGAAACGYLPQQPAPVAHCMWADHSTYTDFYAWNTTPAALAQTMIAIRPQIELARPYAAPAG